MTTQTNTTANYCDAPHENAEEGCFGKPNHAGQHWCWASRATVDEALITVDDHYPYHRKFYWDDAPLEFTKAELKVILMLLQPVKQFFPELQAKVEAGRK